MKRMKGRVLIGTTAVAAALTFGGCGRNQNSSAASATSAAVTEQNNTEDDEHDEAYGYTAETASTAMTSGENADADKERNEGQTITDFEIFQPDNNYNGVVYGPPADK